MLNISNYKNYKILGFFTGRAILALREITNFKKLQTENNFVIFL
jgi:hypothetical protein